MTTPPIRIEVYPYIYANFTIDRPAICSDELFEIDRSNSRAAINHYYWDYENDGTTDEDKTDSKFYPYLYQYRQHQFHPADRAYRYQCSGMRYIVD